MSEIDYSKYRMYILVRDQFPPSVAVNSASHGAMNATLDWNNEDHPHFLGWRNHSFRKITCMVNDTELALANKIMTEQGIKFIEQTESRLDKAHILTICHPFDPNDRAFKAFKFFRTYKWGE